MSLKPVLPPVEEDMDTPTQTTKGLCLEFQEFQEPGKEELVEVVETEVQYDVPETKNMLPPLPSADSSVSLSTPRIENGDFQVEVETPLTPPLKKIIKSNSFIVSPNELPNTANPEPLVSEVLTYSPALSIQERFEVCMDIPLVTESGSPPKTIEEKIKLYEEVQKKEIREFDKTLKNLKQSGWMTEEEIMQLEDAKFSNFNKWENKIKNLKLSMKKSRVNGKSNGYFTEEREQIVNSPSLQNLEKKFSSLEL